MNPLPMFNFQEEEPQYYKDPKDQSIVWKRTGYCNRCGQCCCSGDPFGGQIGEGSVKGACPLFAWENEQLGIGKCINREHPYYKSGCNIWPSEPDHIKGYDKCSYKFERVQ